MQHLYVYIDIIRGDCFILNTCVILCSILVFYISQFVWEWVQGICCVGEYDACMFPGNWHTMICLPEQSGEWYDTSCGSQYLQHEGILSMRFTQQQLILKENN